MLWDSPQMIMVLLKRLCCERFQDLFFCVHFPIVCSSNINAGMKYQLHPFYQAWTDKYMYFNGPNIGN